MVGMVDVASERGPLTFARGDRRRAYWPTVWSVHTRIRVLPDTKYLGRSGGQFQSTLRSGGVSEAVEMGTRREYPTLCRVHDSL